MKGFNFGLTGQRWLNYPQDRRSIIFTLVCMGLLLLPFGFDVPIWMVPGWLLLSSLFCFSVCVINHNHVHHMIFHQPRLNSVFGVLLSLAKGHTSAGVMVAHNYNHHVHNGSEQDWIRPQLAGSGPGMVRLLRFMVAATVAMARGRVQLGNAVLDSTVRRQIRVERSILLLFVAVLLYLDATVFLLFVVLPWFAGIVFLVGVNLLQHDRCEPGSSLNHSRNFTSRLGNWFFFNNGYHTVHHMQPSMHWSLLPAWHEREVAPEIAKQLEQKSVLVFLFKHYLLNN